MRPHVPNRHVLVRHRPLTADGHLKLALHAYPPTDHGCKKGHGEASEPGSLGTSMSTGPLSFSALFRADLRSAGVVARYAVAPKLCASLTKSGFVRLSPMKRPSKAVF